MKIEDVDDLNNWFHNDSKEYDSLKEYFDDNPDDLAELLETGSFTLSNSGRKYELVLSLSIESASE